MANTKKDQRIPVNEVIRRSKEVHGDKYSYVRTGYISDKGIKINVYCYDHGMFIQSAREHSKTQGCPKCGRISVTKAKTDDLEKFIAKVEKVSPNLYDFKYAVYKGASVKLDILCKKHNTVFSTTPASLVQGTGCPSCGKDKAKIFHTKSKDAVIADFRAIHGDRYVYDLVEYVNNRNKVKVICKEHGIFEIQPSNHLMGKGCRKCSKNGYRPNLTGTLYILQADNITKIGITNREADCRSKAVSKSSGKCFKIIKSYTDNNGSIALKVESQVLRELKLSHTSPTEIFDGSTECFYDVDQNQLISRIEELLEENKYGN